MSLVELPSNTGKIIAINPHHVSAVQAYSGYCSGVVGKKDMSAIWVNGHNIYVCAWDVETVTEFLNKARHDEAALFAAGWNAYALSRAMAPSYEDPTGLEIAWMNYVSPVE